MVSADFLFVRSDIFYLSRLSMSTQKNQSKWVRVKRAGTGLGLFAAVDFKRHETIIEYIGERIPTSVGDERDNRYIFNVSSRFDIDGSARYNIARYTNHSCRPNCDALNRRGRIFFVARRKITRGEELTFHYGRDHFEGYIKPFGCKCVKCRVETVPRKLVGQMAMSD